MTTILLNDDNELVITNKERIMQRSKNVDSLQFLIPQMYKDTIDMTPYTCTLEYLLPISKKYNVEILTRDEEMYEETFFRYVLPFDTGFTSEVGEIEFQLTLTYSEMNSEGAITQYVRKSSSCKVSIIPITAWSDVIPDAALNAIDQKVLELKELANELNETAGVIDQTKADNIKIVSESDPDTGEEDKFLTLTADGEEIGDKINLDDLGFDISEVSSEGLIKVII